MYSASFFSLGVLHKTDPTIRSLFHFERRRLSAAEYYSSLGAFRYVFAPRGAGFDTLRAWETISVGGCPILVEDKDCSTLVFEGTCADLVSRMEDLTDPGFDFHEAFFLVS